MPDAVASSAAAAPADVCLVLEGTYPFVAGGVSTWVHQLVCSLPDLRFALLHIGSDAAGTATSKYELPGNVVSVQKVFLFEASVSRSAPLPPATACHAALRAWLRAEVHGPDAWQAVLAAAAPLAAVGSFEQFWQLPGTFDLAADFYDRLCPEESFLDFFWTLRALVEPLWRLLAAVPSLPPARLFHSPCTGYAGLLAAFAARERGVPFLLSEHGIYVKERIADLHRVRWIREVETRFTAAAEPTPALRRLWIDAFDGMARCAYAAAREITALFGRNAAMQQRFGAAAEKIRVVPNGVSLELYGPWREARERAVAGNPGRFTVGFLGRVVAIKDVKTLLRAFALVVRRQPLARLLVAGPADEDRTYFDDCVEFARRLGLGDSVHFTGKSLTLAEFLPQVDCVALSSVSEGLPFVVLEAFAAEIPVVSTDVGACRELVEGTSGDEDERAGFVVPVGDAEQLAGALLSLAADPARAAAFGRAGRQRVERAYTQDGVIASFRSLYLADR